jgi:DGQHR domain-containing protein
MSPDRVLRSPAVRAIVLGVRVYRGFAALADLAEISKADIYDQQNNPKGTQRDLNAAHAREAYSYVKSRDLGFWPEVFLCARRKDVLTFRPASPETPEIGILEIDRKIAADRRSIAISRVDGNHRLHFADGKESGYARIEKLVSFCMAYDLSQEEEIQLFKDINDNQKRMDTSHLDGILIRLTPEEELKRRTPELYVAQRLSRDSSSPLSGRVFEGGRRAVSADMPLRGLKTGIEYMLSRSTQLPHLDDAEAQYRVIRNYFEAVKKWQPKAWTSPKDYIMLRGAGLWAICFVGSQVIDLALQEGKFKVPDLLAILRSGKDWDWGKNGDFTGLSGRAGALEISRRVTRKLKNASRKSTKQLMDEIMA